MLPSPPPGSETELILDNYSYSYSFSCSFADGGQSCARETEVFLAATRVRMRGTEDPPSPPDHVLHDSLGFEHVVACEIKTGSLRLIVSTQTQVVASALVGWIGLGCGCC